VFPGTISRWGGIRTERIDLGGTKEKDPIGKGISKETKTIPGVYKRTVGGKSQRRREFQFSTAREKSGALRGHPADHSKTKAPD